MYEIAATIMTIKKTIKTVYFFDKRIAIFVLTLHNITYRGRIKGSTP
jgi:hypothetical protein